jgi:type IV secretory pathway VirB4 component
MAGDEKGITDGRPIRRLPDEDQGWIHGEIAAFFREWRRQRPGEEPVIHDLVAFIETTSAMQALTRREKDRCRIITARLRRFTQGDRGQVFDRPSTFRVGARPVSIGLRNFALTYAADLTPALAVVLTAVLAALGREHGRMIVVVDEAHRITIDPDAGEVLGQLVRQARKHGAGVWMCSQQVHDFVGTDLGRTLIATAATKVILGVEEAALADVRDVFGLSDDEMAAINPPVQGRAVLLSGGERTVVAIVPGPALLALAHSSPEAQTLPAHAPVG